MTPLNIPKPKNQFEKVEFVNGMTQHQLKVLIKRLWTSIQDVATACELDAQPVTRALDALLDGEKISVKALERELLENQISKLVNGTKK